MALTCALILSACAIFSGSTHSILAQPEHGTDGERKLRRDRVEAVALWQLDALPEPTCAKLCIGILNELPLGMSRDQANAHESCIAAGLINLASAQRAASKLKAGLKGQSRVSTIDSSYAQAGLGRHVGSRYNLAILFKEGGRVPNDLHFAGDWFGQPKSHLEAADLILAQLAPITSEERPLAAPEGVETNVRSKGDKWQIDLDWAVMPGPTGSLFVVELVTIPSASEGESELVSFEQTESSAATLFVDRVPVGLAWRVSQVAADGSEYAAGVWTELNPGTERSKAEPVINSVGRVTIRVGTADLPASQLASDLASGLRPSGVWINVVEVEIDQSESTVAYRYPADAELASSVAGFLPVLGPKNAIRLVELPAAPGEIVVTLVGGPSVVDGAD